MVIILKLQVSILLGPKFIIVLILPHLLLFIATCTFVSERERERDRKREGERWDDATSGYFGYTYRDIKGGGMTPPPAH